MRNSNYKLVTGPSIIKPPITQRLKVGYVELEKGAEVGEHVTSQKEEAIIVISGEAKVVIEGENIKAKAGELVYVGPDKKHNVINENSLTLKYVYVVCNI